MSNIDGNRSSGVMEKFTMIARVQHHAGHLEWLLALAQLLELPKERVFFQFDSFHVYRTVNRNIQLKRLLDESGYRILNIRQLLLFGRLIPKLGIESIRRRQSTNALFRILGTLIRFIVRASNSRSFRRLPNRGRILWINNPEVRLEYPHQFEIFSFSTPIGPNMVGPEMRGGLLVRLSKSGWNDYLYFLSPTLLSEWNRQLFSDEPKIPIDASSAKHLIFLALREPNSNNLTREEHEKAIGVLCELAEKNRDFHFVFRPHPRMGRKSLKSSSLLPRHSTTKSYSHPRVLAKNSWVTLSFGGSICIESIVAGTPVIELVTVQKKPPVGLADCLWSPYGLALGTSVDQLRVSLLEILENRDELLAESTLAFDALTGGPPNRGAILTSISRQLELFSPLN